VDAVGEEPAVRREAGEAGRRRGILGALADVDVDADLEFPGQVRGGREGLVAAGERRVDPDEPAPPPERNRRFSSSPRLAPSGPWRSVTP
jgi:hypothetical protein